MLCSRVVSGALYESCIRARVFMGSCSFFACCQQWNSFRRQSWVSARTTKTMKEHQYRKDETRIIIIKCDIHIRSTFVSLPWLNQQMNFKTFQWGSWMAPLNIVSTFFMRKISLEEHFYGMFYFLLCSRSSFHRVRERLREREPPALAAAESVSTPSIKSTIHNREFSGAF